MNKQHLIFDELCETARIRGFDAELVVEERHVTQVRIARRATPNDVIVVQAPASLASLDEASRDLLRAIR